jgi:hypothetical protein
VCWLNEDAIVVLYPKMRTSLGKFEHIVRWFGNEDWGTYLLNPGGWAIRARSYPFDWEMQETGGGGGGGGQKRQW